MADSGTKRIRRKRGIDRLVAIVAKLRGKGGCPWDRKQTLSSLRQYLIEESYEVLDALDSGDSVRHKEELGDVLLQVVLHSQLRAEKKEFSFDDVAETVSDKLVRRHPHVFGNVRVRSARQVLKNWELIKSKEKDGRRSVLDGVPRHLPALLRAQRHQSKASRVGFDWRRVKDVIAKVDEELAETREVVSSRVKLSAEIGDLLFAVVNLARFRDISAEDCLDAAIAKFVRRFRKVENMARRDGRRMGECSPAQLDDYWEAVKRQERSAPRIRNRSSAAGARRNSAEGSAWQQEPAQPQARRRAGRRESAVQPGGPSLPLSRPSFA